MTTEELKIKVSLETQRLKQELRLLKQAFKDIKLDSKNKNEANELNRSLERVEDTLRDIDRLDFGDNLARGINKAKDAAKDLEKSTKGITKGTNGTTSNSAAITGDQLAGVQNTMESIMGLQFFDLIVDNFDKMSAAVKGFGAILKAEVLGGLTHAKNSFGWIAGVDFADMIGNIANGLQSLFTGDLKMAMAHFKQAFGQDLTILLKNAGRAVKSLASAFLGLGATVGAILGVAAAITGLAGAIAALVRAKDNAQAAFSAQRIGMTTNAYGEWGYVMQQTGGDIDDLTDFVRTLSAAQNEVRAGSEDLIAAFERLGMSAEEISGMSQGEMFARTIEGLQNVKDEVERVSLAYKIFGEDDGAKVTNLMNLNNAEIERMINNYYLLGGAMSAGLVNNSIRLTNSLGNLKIAWTGLVNTLAEAFLPIIIPVVQWLTKAVAVVNMFIRAIFGKEIVVAKDNITNVASAYTGYTNSADKATNSTNRVTEAIERLKRVTMGFDELNKLPGVDKTGSSSSGTDGGTGSSGVGQLPTGGVTGGLDLPTAEDLGLDGIAEWIDKNKQKIQDITAILLTFGGIALAVFCILHGNLAGFLIGCGLASIGISVGNGEDGIWTRLVDNIKSVWENVKTWFSQHVAPVFTKKYWSDKWNSFTDGAKDAWEKFKQSPAGQFFAGIGNKVIELKAKFTEVGSNIKTSVINAWDKLKNKTAELKTKFTDAWSGTRQRLTDAWGKIKTKTATLTGNFKRTGYYQTLSNYWDKFKTKTSTLTVAFKDAFTSKIKAAWNGLVKAINKAITHINKIPGVNIPKLPQLATGGIVTGPTTALIGEAGREAVLPLDRNTGWMDALADKIAAKGGNNNAPSKIVLTVDGKQLGWATIDNINSITKQTGVLPLQLV